MPRFREDATDERVSRGGERDRGIGSSRDLVNRCACVGTRRDAKTQTFVDHRYHGPHTGRRFGRLKFAKAFHYEVSNVGRYGQTFHWNTVLVLDIEKSEQCIDGLFRVCNIGGLRDRNLFQSTREYLGRNVRLPIGT